MNYTSIFDFPQLDALGVSVVQTAVLFGVILGGLHLAGRRVFAESSPQDLVTIVLVGEACNQGLSAQDAGFWGAMASVMTLLVLGILTERIPAIRRLLSRKPIVLYKQGSLNKKALADNLLDESDLHEAARRNGLPSYQSFDEILIEGDGRVNGVFRKQ